MSGTFFAAGDPMAFTELEAVHFYDVTPASTFELSNLEMIYVAEIS